MAIKLSPEPIYRFLAKIITRSLYDIEYIGFEKLPESGPFIIIANHVSYIDGLLIQCGMKRNVSFIIDQYIYEIPMVKHFMQYTKPIPILPKKESVGQALDEVSRILESGEVVGIFPEGQLTYTGNLGRFKPGIEWIIERDPVPIYPIALKGLWNSMFSRKYRHTKTRWFPKGFRGEIKIICGDPIHPGHVMVNHLQRVILSLKNSV